MVTFVVSSLASLPVLFLFSFTLMLYVISLAKTSVTCHKAVNQVKSLIFPYLKRGSVLA